MGACLSEETVDKNEMTILKDSHTGEGQSNQKQKNGGRPMKGSAVRVNIDDATPGLKDIFTLFSCPIQNSNIIEKTTLLSKANRQLTIKMENAKWKEIQYPELQGKNGVVWGICKWKNEGDQTLNGRAYLYFYENAQQSLKDVHKEGKARPSEFLIGGMFTNGKINSLESHYKIIGNGSYYFGKLNQQMLPQGQGEFIYINSDVYRGSFIKGIPNGDGELRTSEKTFKGTFKNGEKVQGEEVGQKGRYIGHFKDNMRHGKGTLTLNTGLKYEGNFDMNKRHGQGKLTDKNGKVVYNGQWIWDSRKNK